MKKLNLKLYKPNLTVAFFLLVTITLFAFGVVYEESSTASRAISFKGLFTDPVTDWPITQIFISHVYAFLYKFSQDIPWYGIIDYSAVIVSIFLCLRVFLSTNVLIFFIPFFILIVDDIVLFSFTRTAMLTSVAGLISLFLLLKNSSQNSLIFYVQIALFSLLCLHGFFNRPQAFAYVAVLFFLFLFFYFLLYRDELKQTKRSMYFLFTPFVLVSVFFIIYQSNIPPSIKKSQELAPKFYNFHSSNYHDSFDDLSKRDSLTLALIKESYVNDLEVMNEAFATRITKTQPKKYLTIEKFTDFDRLKSTTKKYVPFYLKHHFFDLFILGSIFLLILLSRSVSKKTKILISVFVSLSILSLFAITNIVKMEMRISSPTFLMIFLCTLILFGQQSTIIGDFKSKVIIILVNLFSIYYLFSISTKLFEVSKRQYYRINKNIEFKNKLDKSYKGKTIILSNSSLNILHRFPFQEFENKRTFDLHFFEGEAMVYQPTFQRSFISYCGSLRVEDIFDKIFEEKNKTFYIATPEWKKLMTDYLEVHYNKRYQLKEFDTLKFNDDRFDDLILYKPINIIETK